MRHACITREGRIIRKGISLLVVLLLLTILLPGCYDYSEPDDKAWVLAIGMDKGRENLLTVTTVIAIPKNIAGGSGGEPAAGGGGNGNFTTISMESPTLLDTLELLAAVVDRRPDLAHTKWFVFSREIAEEGIEKYFAPLARFYQFRRNSYIVVSEDRAEELLAKGKPKLEDNVGKFYELIQRGWRHVDFIPFDTLHHFYWKSKTPGVEPVIMLTALKNEEPVYEDDAPKSVGEYRAGSIPRKGGSPIEVMGAAVFTEGKMVGTLNGNQLGAMRMITGDLRRTIRSVPDPGQPDSYIIAEVKPRRHPRVNVQIIEGLPQIDVVVELEGNLMSVQSGVNYENPEKMHIAEAAIISSLTQDIRDTVAMSQELGADFFGFGLQAKKLFRTWPEWEAYQWNTKYPQANINVRVDYRLRRIGLLRQTAPLQ